MKLAIDLEKTFESLRKRLNEREERIFAAAVATGLGYGGINAVAATTGLSRQTVASGVKSFSTNEPLALENRQRKIGGGRKTLASKDQTLKSDLDSLVSPHTRGNPMNPLLWTTKSLRKLESELRVMGHAVSYFTVRTLLLESGYRLQSCQKTHEGGEHADRDAQFQHINDTTRKFGHEEQPVISVDAKKKELVGNYKNNGREYQPSGEPVKTEVYDFPDSALGKATPYGIFDINNNEGFVNVGVSRDTAEFAVSSIERWWLTMGSQRYPDAHSLYITADGGGSNGSRNRLWKISLQKFATKYSLQIYVSHFPPGTSKWNKIEHRLFSAISMNWRGRPLETYEIIVELIGHVTNASGLRVRSTLDRQDYKTGITIDDAQMERVNILHHEFHPEWNYAILSQEKC
ncbi:MAG: ISAzo13 family transposase [Lentisphaeria bacterium]